MRSGAARATDIRPRLPDAARGGWPALVETLASSDDRESVQEPGHPIVAGATATFFGGLSRLRRKRIFHPRGVGFEATLTPDGTTRAGCELFDRDSPVEALVRLSRSLGLPEWLSDPCGLALRVPNAYGPDRHQDILLVTSGRAPLARHMLLPNRGFAARSYSSLLPYRIDGQAMLVGAEPSGPCPGPRVAELRSRQRADLSFAITLATPRGDWREVARLTLGRRLPAAETEALRFNPARSGGGIEPIGFLNGLRPPAYRGSQEGRRAAVVAASESGNGPASDSTKGP
jgi:hypothetical protein